MISWPVVAVILVVMIVVALETGRVLRNRRQEDSEPMVDCPRCGGSGFSGFGSGYDAVCDECGGQRQMPLSLTKSMEVRRVAMHNRFMPDEASGPARDSLLVDQILADQRIADEKPGARTKAPAPGEPGYVLPHERIEVQVGDKTIILRRDGPPLLRERTYAGLLGENPVEFEVAEPWDDIVTMMAFEIYRLREAF